MRKRLFPLATLALFLTAISCSNDSPTGPDGGGGPEDPDGWFWQNPKPFGYTINSIDAPATDVAIAVGPAGLILRTTDGGATWIHQDSGTETDLEGVSFFDARVGFALGGSSLLHTSDGGSTWTDVRANAPFPPRGVSATGALSASLVGRVGEFAQTTDGGLSWTPRPLPGPDTPYDIDFVSPSTGFISTFDWNARVVVALSTTDGGANWTRVATGLDFILNDLFAWDANNAWIVGFKGMVIRTSDGGLNWTPSTVAGTSSGNVLTSVAFLSASTGYATMAPDIIHKTIDSGVTWSVVYDRSPHRLNDIAFANASQGIVVGVGGTTLRSTNGGNNWTNTTQAVALYSLQDVSFTSTQRGSAVGFDQIVSTTNGGSTWIDQAPNQVGQPAEYLRAVSFADASHGAAVGDDGEILWTNDGGQIWVRKTSPTDRDLLGVHVLNAQTATIVGGGRGDGMVILKTTDGGDNWQQQLNTAASDSTLESVWMIDANLGIAIGYDDDNYDGIILRTTDGGDSWAALTGFDQSAFFYYDVCFVGANLGFIVGYDDDESEGLILRTTDGGVTWEHRASGQDLEALNSVSFADANHGIVVGDGFRQSGQISVTTNGGLTWQEQITGIGLNFHGVAMPSAGTATIVGDTGAILRTTTGGVR
jgi:photosystem II stability/assembly factor-like uncharacterized protein